MKRLAIIGSGDLGQQIAHHSAEDERYQVVGFFDDFQTKGSVRHNLPVLGNVGEVLQSFQNNLFDSLIIGIGYKHFEKRKELYDQFKGVIPFGSIIHRTSYIDVSCQLGSGIFIYPGCILDMNVVIEDNVILNVGCAIAHDSRIGQHSIVSPGVKIAGFVEIGKSVNLGIGTVVIDNIKIGDGVRTGGGTVVVDSVKDPGLYLGVPAKFIKA